MCNFIQERAYILHGDSFTYQKFNKNPIAEKIDFTAKEQRKDKPKWKHVRVDQKPLHHPPSEPGSLLQQGRFRKLGRPQDIRRKVFCIKGVAVKSGDRAHQ